MSKHMLYNFDEVIELIQKYPHIQYQYDDKEESLSIEIKTQTGPLRAVFEKPWVLQNLLETFDGFKKIHFPGRKTSILFRDRLLAFGRNINPYHTKSVLEKFTLSSDQFDYEVFIDDKHDLNIIITLILQENLSYLNFKKNYHNYTNEYTIRWFGGADIVWDASHLLMLMNSTDIDAPIGLPLPLLNYPRWDSIFIIQPQKKTRESLEFLNNNSDAIIDFLRFEYYRAHNELVEIPNLQKYSWHPDPVDWGMVPRAEKEPRMRNTRFHAVDPILMERLRVSEHSKIPSFQFLSFYHILEYFFDSIALRSLIEEIQTTLEAPDIHERTSWYAQQIASSLTDSNPHRMDEKTKLRGVLTKFVPFPIKEQFSKELIIHINQSTKFEDGLILEPIRMTNPNEFFSDLANRIYKLRCAIVHSNPDYKRERAHVSLSEENMNFVSKEVELLRTLVLEVIRRSTP